MLLIQQITDDPKQRHTLILPDGSTVVMVLEYKSLQQGWFITSLTHNSFQLNNIRVVTSPNILRQFRNQIPFGMACFVHGNNEATLAGDFLSGRAQLLILTASEVDDYEGILNGQVSA